MRLSYALVAIMALLATSSANAQYDPTWESVDSRPLPDWYDDAKFGIFIHWGVFSVPAYEEYADNCLHFGTCGSEWYWKHLNESHTLREWQAAHYGVDFSYPDFAPMFDATFWNPDEWAQIIEGSGAKYAVLTSKHHEGFTNWPSSTSFNWNSVDTGPHRDIVGELTEAVRKTNVTMGLYLSLFEWYHPLYLQDEANGYKTTTYVDQILKPQMQEIINKYQPEVLWSDGDWMAPSEYWGSPEFLSWLYNDSPVKDTIVVNDRWGKGTTCHHGGYYTCSDRFNPGHLLPHKWENAMTIDRTSWGWSRTSPLSNYFSIDDLLYSLSSTVACGGNLLLNVGPAKDGTIPVIFQDRLKRMGDWLKVNGESIYNTQPYKYQNNTAASVWYTQMKPAHLEAQKELVDSGVESAVYAIALKWPGSILNLAEITPTDSSVVSLLGYPDALVFKAGSTGGIVISVPDPNSVPDTVKNAFVFRVTNAAIPA